MAHDLKAAIGHRGHYVSDEDRRPGHPRHHEIVSELAPEEVRRLLISPTVIIDSIERRSKSTKSIK